MHSALEKKCGRTLLAKKISSRGIKGYFRDAHTLCEATVLRSSQQQALQG